MPRKDSFFQNVLSPLLLLAAIMTVLVLGFAIPGSTKAESAWKAVSVCAPLLAAAGAFFTALHLIAKAPAEEGRNPHLKDIGDICFLAFFVLFPIILVLEGAHVVLLKQGLAAYDGLGIVVHGFAGLAAVAALTGTVYRCMHPR